MVVGGISSVSNALAAQPARANNDGDADDVARSSAGAQVAAAQKVNDGDADDAIKSAPRISNSTQAALLSLQSNE